MPRMTRADRVRRAVPGSRLIVVTRRGADVRPVQDRAAAVRGQLQLLFSRSTERLRFEADCCRRDTGQQPPDLTRFHRVLVPPEGLGEAAERLAEVGEVEAAYIAPPVEVPHCPSLRDMAPLEVPPPVPSPDFTRRQVYLGRGPAGIDARHAWRRPGGTGEGVRIVDIEGAWCFTHEDLLQNQGGLMGGEPSRDPGYRNHGTAVMGMLGGDRNGQGVIGICPDAHLRAIAAAVSDDPEAPARAIRRAANGLRAGDIILLEMHSPGPRADFQPNPDRRGYIPIEWWPHNWAAIRYAVSRGILVVEAAGNGFQDLDHPDYDEGDVDFPATWRNPFRRQGRHDSGAILVGAGAPPPGTHDEDCGPDRSRLDFSNHGQAVDVQGWGKMITTCGYGTLQGGPSENHWYTDHFGGTSGAAPMVTGALACLQGILRAERRRPLTPARARQLLRTTGWPQQPAPGRPVTERIGNRPDLRQLLATLDRGRRRRR